MAFAPVHRPAGDSTNNPPRSIGRNKSGHRREARVNCLGRQDCVAKSCGRVAGAIRLKGCLETVQDPARVVRLCLANCERVRLPASHTRFLDSRIKREALRVAVCAVHLGASRGLSPIPTAGVYLMPKNFTIFPVSLTTCGAMAW